MQEERKIRYDEEERDEDRLIWELNQCAWKEVRHTKTTEVPFSMAPATHEYVAVAGSA